jgi:hypothetical protein
MQAGRLIVPDYLKVFDFIEEMETKPDVLQIGISKYQPLQKPVFLAMRIAILNLYLVAGMNGVSLHNIQKELCESGFLPGAKPEVSFRGYSASTEMN